MAVEVKRGCGFRQVGGLYLVGDQLAAPCDRLPFPLEVCPCCGAGIKFTRGFTWIQPTKLLEGSHNPINDCLCYSQTLNACPVCFPLDRFGKDGRAGLLWIGEKFYTPAEFIKEGLTQGISRRIAAIPRGFKIGETWVFFAHISAAIKVETIDDQEKKENGKLFNSEPVSIPGIFAAFRPTRIERIVLQSEFDIFQMVEKELSRPEYHQEGAQAVFEATPFENDLVYEEIYKRLKSDVDRGITLVPVPDDDPDHNQKAKK